MKDIQDLLPHSRKGKSLCFSGRLWMLFCYIFNVDTKLDRKDKLEVINEVHVGSVKVKCCS